MKSVRLLPLLGWAALICACSGGTSHPGPDSGSPGDSGSRGNDGGTTPDGGNPGDGGSSGTILPFPPGSILYQDVTNAALDSNSAPTIAHLGSWGTPAMKIDFSFAVQLADNTVATRAFQNGAVYQTPDCDTAPTPIPSGGWMEGASNYQCQAGAYHDCHLTVYQGTRLFEIFQADITGGLATGGIFYAGCETVWDLNKDYWKSGTPFSRGDFCAGADASGMPIAPLLAMGSDFEAGAINHALRLRLPDASINMTSFVHPATHIGSNPSGDAMMPMLGARFRLRPDYPVASLPSSGAQLVARALQKYGMFLADDRPTPLTFDQSASQYIGADDLAGLQVSDFSIVASPDAPVTVTGASSCQRTPVTQ
jgi:hypothetical protein